MTREHIIPNFLYREFPNQKLGYNQRADKYMTWEAVVRDVCERCNGGPLSALDNYARTFLKAVKYERTYETTADITFSYDFDLLARWLLKVSFNAARALSRAPALLKATVPYILRGEIRPSIAFLSIEVLRDTPVPDSERHHLPSEGRDWHHIPTRMFRIGPGGLNLSPIQSLGVPEYCYRFVEINAWFFTICLVPTAAERPMKRRLLRLYRSALPDATILTPYGHAESVRVSRRTSLEAYAQQGTRVARQWQEYLANLGTRTV
jgi:hypothetical protein